MLLAHFAIQSNLKMTSLNDPIKMFRNWYTHRTWQGYKRKVSPHEILPSPLSAARELCFMFDIISPIWCRLALIQYSWREALTEIVAFEQQILMDAKSTTKLDEVFHIVSREKTSPRGVFPTSSFDRWNGLKKLKKRHFVITKYQLSLIFIWIFLVTPLALPASTETRARSWMTLASRQTMAPLSRDSKKLSPVTQSTSERRIKKCLN